MQFEQVFDVQGVGSYPATAQVNFGFTATHISVSCDAGGAWLLALGASPDHTDDIVCSMRKSSQPLVYKIGRTTDKLWLRKLSGHPSEPLRVKITATDG